MFDNIMKIFKRLNKKENKIANNSKDAAKERLHLVLMQDRANVSADFLELMKQEIIEVIKKYIDVDESAIDVRLTNKENSDGTNGAPALYANIPILNIKNETRKIDLKQNKTEQESETNKTENKSIEEREKTQNKALEEKEKTESKTAEVKEKAESEGLEAKKENKTEKKQEQKKEIETDKKQKDLEQEQKEDTVEKNNKKNQKKKLNQKIS